MKFSITKGGRQVHPYIYVDREIFPRSQWIEVTGLLSEGLTLIPVQSAGNIRENRAKHIRRINQLPNGSTTRTLRIPTELLGSNPAKLTTAPLPLTWLEPPSGDKGGILNPLIIPASAYKSEVRRINPEVKMRPSHPLSQSEKLVSLAALAKISRLLDAHYSASTIAYSAGFSDERLAALTGYSENVVKNIRESLFGVEEDKELEGLKSKLAYLQDDLSALAQQLANYKRKK